MSMDGCGVTSVGMGRDGKRIDAPLFVTIDQPRRNGADVRAGADK